MQDFIFYVAPYGTRGIVRDCRNAHNVVPPSITRGVPARLRLRLFADRSSDLPYPPETLTGLSWRFIMDDDWDRGTVCKLAADSAAITVRTVSDVVDGAAKQFTEFLIPLYDTDIDSADGSGHSSLLPLPRIRARITITYPTTRKGFLMATG